MTEQVRRLIAPRTGDNEDVHLRTVLVDGACGVRLVIQVRLKKGVQVKFDIGSNPYDKYFLGAVLGKLVVRLFSGAPELMSLADCPLDVPDFLARGASER